MWIPVPGSERFPGGGHGNPLQYSYLENPWTEEPGKATDYGVAKSGIQLSMHACTGPVRTEFVSHVGRAIPKAQPCARAQWELCKYGARRGLPQRSRWDQGSALREGGTALSRASVDPDPGSSQLSACSAGPLPRLFLHQPPSLRAYVCPGSEHQECCACAHVLEGGEEVVAGFGGGAAPRLGDSISSAWRARLSPT